jgi:hypothetical protein
VPIPNIGFEDKTSIMDKKSDTKPNINFSEPAPDEHEM